MSFFIEARKIILSDAPLVLPMYPEHEAWKRDAESLWNTRAFHEIYAPAVQTAHAEQMEMYDQLPKNKTQQVLIAYSNTLYISYQPVTVNNACIIASDPVGPTTANKPALHNPADNPCFSVTPMNDLLVFYPMY